uniref:Uncharacterized protein n=1 Tax=Anguilla anguilla TaxID=7936 RepID=A0A0E9QYV7_ANGAN
MYFPLRSLRFTPGVCTSSCTAACGSLPNIQKE